jgi:DNA-binding response OmpR family regulator
MQRLLVIDDSPTIRKVVELTFRRTSWEVVFAGSGAEGVSLATGQPPSLILLDYVLPDMRGLDVCSRLAADPRTARVPILLVTAKAEDIKRLFEPYPSVVGFIKKPFTSDELLARVRAVAGDQPARRGPFTHAQLEAGAKAVHARMARVFALIPSWCAQMGAQAPAGFFARKILTPEVMSDLLEALEPIARQNASVTAAGAPADAGLATGLSGELRDWPVADLITLVGASGRTGELRLARRDASAFWLAYFRAGELVLVTSSEPGDHDVEGEARVAVSPDLKARAEAEQRATGKPTCVTIADGGGARSSEISELVHRAGRRILKSVLESRDLSFSWRDCRALPEWVTSYGRYVPLARNTLLYSKQETPTTDTPPPSLYDLALDRAREESLTRTHGWPTGDRVLTRARGFSGRVRTLALSNVERRVLTLVNDRSTLREIASRLALPEEDVRRIAFVLTEVGLLAADVRPRPILLLESDDEGFSEPLASLLSGRSDPVPLISLHGGDDLVSVALRENPAMVILNATQAADANGAARALRSHDVLAGIPLVALLDLPSATREPELRAAGFDAVLVKPVPFADIESLIGL